MKTYIFSSINRIMRQSKALDAKAFLCDKSWIVFNDGTEKEVYKFRNDGSLIISISGQVNKGKWEYDPIDNSLILSIGEQAILVQAKVLEGFILGLLKDGTNECSFMIDEQKAHDFTPKTIDSLVKYLNDKEDRRIIEEKKEKLIKERQRQEQLRIEQENESIEQYENQIVEKFRYYLKLQNYKPDIIKQPLAIQIAWLIPLFFIAAILGILAMNILEFIGLETYSSFVGIVIFIVLLINFSIDIFNSRKEIQKNEKFDFYYQSFVNSHVDQQKLSERLILRLQAIAVEMPAEKN